MTTDEAGDVRIRALMARYQAGELEAFDELYALAAPVVGRWLRGRAADPARVEDLVQDTFLALHRARHTYDPARPVLPWLFAIARHTWLMDLRTAGRRPRATAIVDETYAAPAPRVAERAGAGRDLARALAGLKPSGRGALVLHHVWGYSFAEIARRTGTSEAAAKLRSSRAMKSLRRLLAAPAREEAR